MFRGRFEHTIDTKGRISLPAKFREVFSLIGDDRLIVTNFDHCLWAYPISEWQKIEDKVANLPQFKPEVIALQRVFISAAVESNIDKQGRIMIPPSLRDYADLKKNTVIVGMTKRIEIWNKANWWKEFEKQQKDIFKNPQGLSDLGL